MIHDNLATLYLARLSTAAGGGESEEGGASGGDGGVIERGVRMPGSSGAPAGEVVSLGVSYEISNLTLAH